MSSSHLTRKHASTHTHIYIPRRFSPLAHVPPYLTTTYLSKIQRNKPLLPLLRTFCYNLREQIFEATSLSTKEPILYKHTYPNSATNLLRLILRTTITDDVIFLLFKDEFRRQFEREVRILTGYLLRVCILRTLPLGVKIGLFESASGHTCRLFIFRVIT